MNRIDHDLLSQSVDIDLCGENMTKRANEEGTASECCMSFDMQTTGKQQGFLEITVSTQVEAHKIRVPVCVIRGTQNGPTITMIAGVHGDEYEGTIVLRRLARELDAHNVCGCLMLLPAINSAALETGEQRHAVDDQDLNFAFTDDADGSPSEQLAYHITRQFIEPSELIVDLRSGGRHLQFASSAVVRFSEDREHQQRCEESMIAFGAPNSIRMPMSHNPSGLGASVLAKGKTYLQTALGGGLTYTARTLDQAYTGCLNVLRHKGLLQEDIELSSTRLLEVRDDSYFLYAEQAGIFEPVSYLGENVFKGYPLANILPLAGSSSDTVIVNAHSNAKLIATHPGGHVNEGDLIAIIADEVRS